MPVNPVDLSIGAIRLLAQQFGQALHCAREAKAAEVATLPSPLAPL